jgi:hypothetical protein
LKLFLLGPSLSLDLDETLTDSGEDYPSGIVILLQSPDEPGLADFELVDCL